MIRWKQIVALLLCLSFSASLAYEMRQSAPGRLLMVDFAAVYYASRCALHHADPYDPKTILQELKSDGGKFLPNPIAARESKYAVAWEVNLPSALFVVAPFAALPWAIAHNLWIILIAALLALAAVLVLDLAGGTASLVSCGLLCFMLANCELLFKVGNLAGAVVALAAISAWCFLRRRYELGGVVLMALSLLLKPHDSGFIWLFFLLSGGALRKRALQTLALTAALGLGSALWIAQSSPHWPAELHRNLETITGTGGIDDPGPTGMTNGGIVPIVSLQSSLSVFHNDPHFYSPPSYLICSILILTWIAAVLRKRFSPEGALLALAAISMLTVLAVYHRTYDAKVLILSIPALAVLWAAKGPKRWIALVLTAAAILATSDIPIAFSLKLAEALPRYPTTLAGKIATVLFLRPAPLIILANACFYLWIYLRYQSPSAALPQQDGARSSPAISAAT